ncbi:ABC transporter substrate-binding protein [Halobacteria archaeon AArc-curdl1]|uniref:ABC transporter substrate-binding protein n=1 Tax=Natronosalvus hydrolyticus TaxID=2979988 RepID=A0AAP2Z850_9EURY|nr:ABC transporter substrate-binding protein [Halobacteria archaeon AArc-curdl1]
MKRVTAQQTRRSYLAGLGAASLTGVAGCLGGDDGIDELTVAYMPIFPDLQYFVMESEEYLAEIDADIDSREFTDGPAIVQAFGGGEVDIAMFGIVPSMIVIDRGIGAKVTATNIKEPMAILAHDEFHTLWDEHGTDAFDVWEDEHGDPFRFGTFPQGSVPDTLLRYWLQTEAGIDPDTLEIVEIGGANAVFQAISNGEIDGTSIMEPVPTRADLEELPVSTLRTSAEIMPGQPAAVTLMTDAVRDAPVAEEFLRQHVRATEFINDDPATTAEIVEDGIGMPAEHAALALEGPLSNFVTDPREIESGTETFAQLAHENGQLDEHLSLEQIFDYEIYDGL